MANASCFILWWDNNDEDGCEHVLNVYHMPSTELNALIFTTVSKIETIIIPVLSLSQNNSRRPVAKWHRCKWKNQDPNPVLCDSGT